MALETSNNITYSISCYPNITGLDCTCPECKKQRNKNPYVPAEIHVNKEEKIVVVKWEDGTEIKVTCDNDDSFNVDAGFAQALKYKIFGGKTEYKEKWWKIIGRRIHLHENKKSVVPMSKRLK